MEPFTGLAQILVSCSTSSPLPCMWGARLRVVLSAPACSLKTRPWPGRKHETRRLAGASACSPAPSGTPGLHPHGLVPRPSAPWPPYGRTNYQPSYDARVVLLLSSLHCTVAPSYPRPAPAHAIQVGPRGQARSTLAVLLRQVRQLRAYPRLDRFDL